MREQSEPTVQKAAKYTGDQGAGVDLAPIVLEIVINGDGGEYLDCIVQPLFQFLAYQVNIQNSNSIHKENIFKE